MRKNNFVRERIRGCYYSRYKISGQNTDVLLNRLNRTGIAIYKAKKTSGGIILTVKTADNKKLFAICNELCYNIKLVKESGKYFPMILLLRNFGVIIGIVVFIGLSLYADNKILGFSFEGTGNVYSMQVEEFLSQKGITKNSNFSAVNLARLEDEILSNFDCLSFVSCQKHGNTLKINLAISSEEKKSIDCSVKQLISTVDGTVWELKVYRGLAKVGVGDYVKAGDVLVDGDIEIKETVVSTNVLAQVKIMQTAEFEFFSSNADFKENALLLAKEQITGEYFSSTVVSAETQNGYKYTVSVNQLFTFIAG